MNRSLKIGLTVLLLAAACVLAVKFHRAYRAVMHAAPPELSEGGDTPSAIRARSRSGASRRPPPRPAAGTNAPAVSRETGPAGSTNLPPAGEATNLAATAEEPEETNMPAAAGEPSLTNVVRPGAASSTNAAAAGGTRKDEPGFSTLMGYGAGLFFVVVCLGVILAHDFSHFVADRFTSFVLSEEGEEMRIPEYEKAEQLVMDNQPLEGIQLMRECLKKKPRKLYIAIRIAEVYEKDLGNYLAAALELEEVLKHRLRPEQWGWAAIHLANLYSGKLGQTGKAVALLRRIETEHGSTAAAAKARARLSQLENGDQPAGAISVEIEEEARPPSSLPKGFRPKGK